MCSMTRSRKISAALLVLVAALGTAADASARRHADGRCRTETGTRPCRIDTTRRPQYPLALSVPPTCQTQNVLVAASALNRSQAQGLTVRLDGVTIGTATSARRGFVSIGLDCAALGVGEHVLTATLTRRGHVPLKVVRKLTRLAGETPVEPDDGR
jgi:hypothetical protein